MDGPHVEKTCGIWKSVWEVAMVVFYVFMWTQISKEIKCILPYMSESVFEWCDQRVQVIYEPFSKHDKMWISKKLNE